MRRDMGNVGTPFVIKKQPDINTYGGGKPTTYIVDK